MEGESLFLYSYRLRRKGWMLIFEVGEGAKKKNYLLKMSLQRSRPQRSLCAVNGCILAGSSNERGSS